MTPAETMQKIAQAAGLSDFGSVTEMNYTFKVEIGDRKISRAWTWYPQSNEVVLRGATEADTVRYDRGTLTADSGKDLLKLDRQFVNDQYWLIYPFHVVWDPSASVVELPAEAAAVVPAAKSGIRVVHADGVGYTPGDVYDVFYDDDYLITHWVFRKGGSSKASRVTEWNDYQQFGPLTISLDRPSPGGGGFRLWFEDVSVH